MKKGRWTKRPNPYKLAFAAAMLGLLIWTETSGCSRGLVTFIAVLMLLQFVGAFYERPLGGTDVSEQQGYSDKEMQEMDASL